MLRKGPSQPVAVLSLCAAYALYCLVTMPPGPVTAPDSQGYLGLWPVHTLGYPLFLKMFGARGATIAQPVLFALALAWLGAETRRLTSSDWPAIAAVLAPIVVPDLTTYHASILTESLFVSGMIGMLAAMTRFVRAPSWRTAAAASVIAGLTATVRRTGLAFLPVLAIMVLLQRRNAAGRWKMLAAAIVPMLAVTAGERVAARVVHGADLTSIIGRHLYAKASLIDAPPPRRRSQDALRAQLEHQLNVAYAPVRNLINRAPRDVGGVLSLYYETCLQGPCVPELGQSPAGTEGRGMNEALMQTGLERISRAPLRFASLTIRHYYSLWSAYRQRHPETAPALTAFIASNRPLPFEREAFKSNPADPLEFRPYAPVRFVQPMTLLAGLITGGLALLGPVAAASRRVLSPTMMAASLAALAAHAGLLFTALLAAGISRFIVSLWPAITTAIILASWSAVNGTPRRAVKGLVVGP